MVGTMFLIWFYNSDFKFWTQQDVSEYGNTDTLKFTNFYKSPSLVFLTCWICGLWSAPVMLYVASI